MFGEKLEYGLKVVGSVAALGGLLLAGAQFVVNHSVEAAKPYLERKLKLCEEAVVTAAFIATADAGAAAAEAKTLQFWQLYWGVMGLVANQKVTHAMVAFGAKLRAKESSSSLQVGVLELASACRQEMAASWSPIWRR
ncbi:MAG: hypothetical protein Q7W02_07790 [Candidatus Rokubacteria bacterium]|nr:hypothetical protein [Candidatus Rokubacteria bacterium]